MEVFAILTRKSYRLSVRSDGFTIDYPRRGLIELSLDVHWSKILEVRARRKESGDQVETELHFQLVAGKPMKASVSDAWSGFSEVGAAMERALGLESDWLTRARSLGPGEELLIYRRPSEDFG